MKALATLARRVGSAAVTAVQIAALYDPNGCDCGRPIPADRKGYCSDRCYWADKDHGTDHERDDQ